MALITASIGEIKDGLPEYVRTAEKTPVLVRRRDKPVVFMVGVEDMLRTGMEMTGCEEIPRAALKVVAVNMFDGGLLSLGQAARLVAMSVSDFIDLASTLGISVLRESDVSVAAEVDAFEEWIQSAHATTP